MKQDETMQRIAISDPRQVFVGDIQKLLAIVFGITRRQLGAVARQLTLSATTVGLVGPCQPDAVP